MKYKPMLVSNICRLKTLGLVMLAAASTALAQGKWTVHAPIPFPFGREGSCQGSSDLPNVSGVVSDRIYIIAGFGPFGDSVTNTAYDTATDTYTPGLAPIPGPPRSEGAGVVDQNGLVYCLGGRTFMCLDTNERYNPPTDSWAVLAPMPIPVCDEYSAATIDNTSGNEQIHVIGGRTDGATVPFSAPRTDAHQIYDIATNAWVLGPPLPGGPRAEMCVAAHGREIHVLGGVDTFGVVVNTHDVFNVVTGTWAPAAPMLQSRANAACAFIGNNLYVAGGVSPFGVFLSSTERFDHMTGTWSPQALKPTATAETQGISLGGMMWEVGGGFFGAGSGPLGMINESFKP